MSVDYKKIANEARKKALEMIYKAQTSHIASNFSCADIFAVLYNIANVDKDLKEDRDRIVLSKGWGAATLYFFLSEKGIVAKEDLNTYCQEGSPYIGLAEPGVRGVEAAGGSMGFGLPFSVGFAIAKKIKKERGKAYVIMSDGEMDCGSTWESALIASHQKLDNLVIIADCNGLQAMGETTKILNTEPLKEKWQAFGWEVKEIDGHNYNQIEEALLNLPIISGKPTIILAKTIKGKGVSFMEGKNIYHYKPPSDEQYQQALKELELNG